MTQVFVKAKSFVWHDQPELLNNKITITETLMSVLNFPTAIINTILMGYVMEVSRRSNPKGKYACVGRYKRCVDDSKTMTSMVLLNGVIYVSHENFSDPGHSEYDRKFRMYNSVMNIYTGTHVSVPDRVFKQNDQNISFLKNDHVWICYEPGNSEYTTISKFNTDRNSDDLILSGSGSLQINRDCSIALIKNMAFTYNSWGLHISHHNLIKLPEAKKHPFDVTNGIRLSLPEKAWKLSNINDNLLLITNRRFIIYDPVTLDKIVAFDHSHRFTGTFNFDNDSSAICNNSSNIFILFNNSKEVFVYNVVKETGFSGEYVRIVEDQKTIQLQVSGDASNSNFDIVPNNYLMSADEEFLVIAKENSEISVYRL